MSWLIWVMTVLAAIKPVDPDTLELWEPPPPVAGLHQRTPKHKPYDVYAAGMDGDRLITTVATGTLIILPVNKKVTAHVSGPDREAAYGVLSARLGFNAVPPKLKGKGASVDLRFASAPVVDLMRVLSDISHLNIVAPGDLPKVDIVVERQPWDGVLAEVIKVIGRSSKRFGNTEYVLPAGTKLPELPKLAKAAAKLVLDLDVAGATTGQTLAVVRELTEVPIGVCESSPFSLRLRHVTLPEALRAIEVASGTTLTADGATCPKLKVSRLASAPGADTKLVAIVSIGLERAAVLDHKGEAIIASAADNTVVKSVGRDYLELKGSSLDLHPPAPDYTDPTSEAPDLWVANAKRTAAVIREVDRWTAFVDGPKGLRFVDPMMPVGLLPTGLTTTVDLKGVHATENGRTTDIVLGN
jgi:hypothetical protein